MTNILKEQKEKLMEMNRWTAWNRETSCPTMSGWPEPMAGECSGILETSEEKVASPIGLRTPLSKEGILEAGRAFPTAASSSHSHIQATCGSHSSDGAREDDRRLLTCMEQI